MKKTVVINIIIGLLLTAVITNCKPWEKEPIAPDIVISISLDKTSYLPKEPVEVTMTIENRKGKVITPEGFKARDFRRVLRFTDSKGTLFTARHEDKTSKKEPLPPPVIYIGDTPVQVEKVETVEAKFSQKTAFNARDLYSLPEAYTYSVKAVIPMRTYSNIFQHVKKENFAKIGTAEWWGAIESNTVKFSLGGDKDSDNYSYPEAISPLYKDIADCDDNDPNVHPDAKEIAGNSKDDDCNPKTSDAVAFGTLAIQVLKDKNPMIGIPVRVYDISKDSCASRITTKKQRYKAIWLSCNSVLYGFGKTDSSGTVKMEVALGEHLAIGKYDVETYTGKNVGALRANETLRQDMEWE